ncbi:ATP synthase F1 subunit gamma [Buchnera aphidicola]|uniref:ATP synthase F1 subunit gamma n=1 Tax=Buchnera aphidicola TaxID=9 RepID=UPI0031B89DC6
MANTKLIRNKIVSIKNTNKITKTMEMVAIAKLKNSKKKLLHSLSYLNNIKNIVSNFCTSNIKYRNHLFIPRSIVKTVAIIIITTDRGLCGNLNNNIFKKVNLFLEKYIKKNVFCKLYIFGMKGHMYFKNKYKTCLKKNIFLNDQINPITLQPLIKKIITYYVNEKFDKLFIISNKYVSQVKQSPSFLQLLPIITKDSNNLNFLDSKKWDYIYEPDETITTNYVLKKYILFQCLQCILENIVCEHSARMLTMKTATDNSKKIMHDLKVLYNKVRQYSITQELIEIISGSSTV